MTRNGRIEKGQRVGQVISARAWNRAQEAADIVLAGEGGRHAVGVHGPAPLNAQIYVRNDSGTGVSYWGVLAITGVVAPPTGTTGASVAQFQTEPAVVGVLPATGASGAFVVALEPIAASKFGRAAIAGVVQCKLNVSDATHGFAVPIAGSAAAFASASSGPATILWKDNGTGDGKWALIRIGAGAGVEGPRLGKVSGTWSKGATASVQQYTGAGAMVTGTTFVAINRAQTVTGPTGGYWVGCESIDGTWHLEWAECA